MNENIGWAVERGADGWIIRAEGTHDGRSRLLDPAETRALERLLRDPMLYDEPAHSDPECQDGADDTVSIEFEGKRRDIEVRCDATGRIGTLVEVIARAAPAESR